MKQQFEVFELELEDDDRAHLSFFKFKKKVLLN